MYLRALILSLLWTASADTSDRAGSSMPSYYNVHTDRACGMALMQWSLANIDLDSLRLQEVAPPDEIPNWSFF